jgi:hypothetical protein
MKERVKMIGVDFNNNAREYPNQKSSVLFELRDLDEKICPVEIWYWKNEPCDWTGGWIIKK